jgi:hypothetical protein
VTPYLVAVGGFLCFFVAAAVATLALVLFPSLRRLLPFAWRIWAWGTLGFFSGYLVPNLVLWVLLGTVRGMTGRDPTDSDARLMMLALFYVPPVAAVTGGLVGAAVGYSLARREKRRNSHAAG